MTYPTNFFAEDERCCKALGGQCVPSSQCRISLFPGAICPDNEVCCRQEINPEDCRHGNGECLPPDVCKEKGGLDNLIPCPGDEVCCGDGKESTRECLASGGQCVQEETCKDNGGSPSGVPCPGDLVCCKCKGDDPIGTDDCKKSGGTCVDPDDCRKSSGSDNGVPCPDNLVCCEKKDDVRRWDFNMGNLICGV